MPFLFHKGEKLTKGKHDLNNHKWPVLKGILKGNHIQSTEKQSKLCFHKTAREVQIASDVKILLLCKNRTNKIMDVIVV